MINNKSEQATPPDNLIFLIARFDQILPNLQWVPLFLRSTSPRIWQYILTAAHGTVDKKVFNSLTMTEQVD